MRGSVGYRFGAFQMDCGERVVSHQGRPVELRGKAFELLELLASCGGRVVEKPALLSALWPGVAVVDNNIAVTVRSVRRALLAHDPAVEYVETVPRRGYRLRQPAIPIALSGLVVSQSLVEAGGAQPPLTESKTASSAQPFVARESELRALLGHWAAARRGAGEVVFVSGEPGMGKSVLVRRFAELASEQAPLALVMQGQCLQLFGAAEPYLPFLEALGAGLSGNVRAELLLALEIHAPAWCMRLPGALVGPRARASDEPDTLMWQAPRLARELCDALRGVALSRPLLLVLEDLHWADASSVDLLRFLCAGIDTHRILVLCTYRPVDVRVQRHPLGALLLDLRARERRVELCLRSWEERHVVDYLSRRFGAPGCGAPAFAAELAGLLWRRTEGLPLFVARLAESLAERGVLCRGAIGSWALALPLAELDLSASDSMAAVIDGHLTRLSPQARHVLDVASVEGEEFGTALLSELLGVTPADLEERLNDVASAHGLIERLGEQELGGAAIDVRYRFSHVLFQNVLYAALASHRRLELHRGVAHVFLALQGAGSPSRIALHFERARDYSRAVSFWIDAGDRADRSYAKLEALSCYERAAALLERLPEGESTLRELVLHHGRGWATYGLGRLREAKHHFVEFARLARELEAVRRSAREVALQLASEYFERPWSDTLIQRPAGILPKGSSRVTSAELHAEALHCCCHVSSVQGDAEALSAHARELLTLSDTNHSLPRRAEALAWLGAHALSVRRWQDARSFLDQAIELARSIEHVRALRLALAERARLHLMHAELGLARLAYEELLSLVPEAKSAVLALTALGETLAKQGDPGAALASYARAERLHQRMQRAFPAVHGWLLRELGQYEAARQLDEAAVSALRGHDDKRLLARLLSSLARTSVERGDLTEARRLLSEAEGLMANEDAGCSVGMGPLWSARCELWQAQAAWPELRQSAGLWLDAARAQADAEGVSAACRWLSRCSAADGDWRGARAHLALALDTSKSHPIALTDWRSYALLEEIEQRLGDVEGAAAARLEARRQLDAIARHSN